MPARGFACRAARTKTAKHACESLIPPVVIQHPSLLWLHSHPFHLTVSRPIRAWFFPGFARDELCIVWEFFIVRLQTNLRYRADFSFIRSSIPALHVDFTLFCFNLFSCLFFTFMRASVSVFFFSLIYSLVFFFFFSPMHFDFNDDVVLFQSTRFFLFLFLSTFHIFFLSSSSYKFLMEYPVEVRAPREVHLVISYEKVLFFFVSFLLPSFFTRCFSNTHEITRSFIFAIECHHSVSWC